MQVSLVSLPVKDPIKAHEIYTSKLGFVIKADVPVGEYRWLTVVAKGADEIELLLEPMGFEPARVYQKALFDAGIPLTSFATDDIHAEFKRLTDLGVTFRSEPTEMGPVISAMFEDTCGNLISLVQVKNE